jgi:ribosomal protein S4E
MASALPLVVIVIDAVTIAWGYMHREPTWIDKEGTVVGDGNSMRNGEYPLGLLCSNTSRDSICLQQKARIVIVEDGGKVVLVP